MKINIKIPPIAESIFEVQIAKWFVKNGDLVEKDQEIVEIDSDKTTLTLSSPSTGRIEIIKEESEIVKIDTVIAYLEESNSEQRTEFAETATFSNKTYDSKEVTNKEQTINQQVDEKPLSQKSNIEISFTPLAESKMKIENISKKNVEEFYFKHKLGIKDIEEFTSSNFHSNKAINERIDNRKNLSMLRKKIAERLVRVKNETAMLTSFNEIDMSSLIEYRNKINQIQEEKGENKLGFVSFFAKAAAIALSAFPIINSRIEENQIVEPNYVDISVAVSTDRGLVVPVLRNVEKLSLREIELELRNLTEKARKGSLSISDFEGGTFTITNGGVFGSLMSTPIINPPQSAILGLHTIKDRAVVVDSNIVIRPMMYVALSYDHRIIDGKESVGFLLELKKLIENPNLFV